MRGLAGGGGPAAGPQSSGGRATMVNEQASWISSQRSLLRPRRWGDVGRWGALVQELLAAGVLIPPGGRHLDDKAAVAQVVDHLAVGVGAGIGPEGPALARAVALSGLEQADDRHLAQVLQGVDGAASEVAGDRIRQIQVLQGKGMGGSTGMGIAATVPAAAAGRGRLLRGCGRRWSSSGCWRCCRLKQRELGVHQRESSSGTGASAWLHGDN